MIPGQLTSGQAQVLAAIIRRAGAVTVDVLRDATGLDSRRIRRCLSSLRAKGLVADSEHGHVARVVALSVDQARLSAGCDYDGGEHESARATAATAPERAQQPSLERP